MVRESPTRPATPDDIPKELNEDARELLIQHLEEMHDSSWSSDSTPGKITKEMCELIHKMRDDGVKWDDIIDYFPISSPSALAYHLNDECSHEKRNRVTYSECGWMRVHARNGAKTQTLSILYNLTHRNVVIHLTGECNHEDGIEPLEGSELYKNSRSVDNWVTSECPVCEAEFKHREWRDRTTCSSECNIKYASDIAHSKATVGD